MTIELPHSVFASHPERGTWRVYDDKMTKEKARALAEYLNGHPGCLGTTYEARGYYWRPTPAGSDRPALAKP